MVASPRKRAAPVTTFTHTWDETDAAFLDPNALPLAKVPRGWERKPEVKRVAAGKEKKIWRRFNLRSRAGNTAAPDVQAEEEQDARSRPVKRRQHMSPKAMEKTGDKANGKKRAFQATRWDRRKSVLPRKRATRTDDPAISANPEANRQEGDEESTPDVTEADSLAWNDQDTAMDQQNEPIQGIPAVGDDRSCTFTFTVDAPADRLPGHESPDGYVEMEQEPAFAFEEEGTLLDFLPPSSKPNPTSHIESPEDIVYPELPQSDDREIETQAVLERLDAAEEVYEVVESDIAEEVIPEVVESRKNGLLHLEMAKGGEGKHGEPTPPTPDEDVSDAGDENAGLSEADHDVEERPRSPEADDAEEFTEASLQLNILREYREMLEKNTAPTESEKQQPEMNEADGLPSPPSTEDVDMTEPPPEDITAGLTLSFTALKPTSADPTPQKLHSPPPPLDVDTGADDVTMTVAFDDDTAILKDFLNRAAASKAEKAAVITHRRESLQNRRDSDVVRHALASPRKILEEKDPNSPSKRDNELTLDLSQTLTLGLPNGTLDSPTPGATEIEGTGEKKSSRGSRRSSRTKKSRLPGPASAGQTQGPKIAIRRADGNEIVVLKKDDTKLLADLTRSNTRKNKQGAFGVTIRLMKLSMEAAGLAPIDDATKELIVGKNVRWDETLAYYQENPETLAEAESLATPDELGMPEVVTTTKPKKDKTSKNSTPKIRRVRGLGTANGTPGKALLHAPTTSLLPEAVQEDEQRTPAPAPTPTQQLRPPQPSKSNKTKKMTAAPTSSMMDSPATQLPTLDVTPVGITLASPPPQQQQRTCTSKSRLAAPRKVVLPHTISAPGKENVLLRSGSGSSSSSVATPKKGIPAPKVLVPPTAGMESGLPRRRGRKY
ncbi:hypothetical protein BDW02DRAFT_526929 [Decorospora gaudefroyi]|uniref:Uncharacterized protein n=1 Tax=Decorospora gaudefroyi TaxID=184978 RepID=A0A6A5KDE0_9PLEO|nr:hypothetical protein BDW02DRAFT_526929 [Decorospora gaudefroyi]